MYKILKAEKLADMIYLMDVASPSCGKALSCLVSLSLSRWMKRESVFHLLSVIMTERLERSRLYSRQ